jgi:hypothetical protein
MWVTLTLDVQALMVVKHFAKQYNLSVWLYYQINSMIASTCAYHLYKILYV